MDDKYKSLTTSSADDLTNLKSHFEKGKCKTIESIKEDIQKALLLPKGIITEKGLTATAAIVLHNETYMIKEHFCQEVRRTFEIDSKTKCPYCGEVVG